MKNKKNIACISGVILLLLVVYNFLFIKIDNQRVYRYTEKFRITKECDEKDFKKIGKLKKLSELSIHSENIKSLDCVYDLSSLKKIYIDIAPNLDMSFLSECSELEDLYIFGTPLDSFEHISTLTTLKAIGIQICDIYDISGIKNLKKLETFRFDNCQSDSSITGIEELSELPNLMTVSLGCAKKSDISAIAECKNITSLSLRESNENIDAAELLKLEKLRELSITGSSLENAEKLLEFKELRDITFSEDMVNRTFIDSLEKSNIVNVKLV
jgi:ribosomal protein L7/L12